MTLSVIFLTRTNVVLKHMLSWHTWALRILNSICIFPPLAEVNLSLIFLKYLEGMIPSWMQLRLAPESIKAMTSNSKSLLMTILTLECYFWKLILLMVSRNFTLDSSWTISAIGLTVSSSPSEGLWNKVPSSLPRWELFSNCFNLWSRKLWSTLRMANSCLRVLTSDLVSLISF